MKKFTLLLLFTLLITSIGGYAQTGAGATLQSFETGDGTAGLGGLFGGGLAEIVDDPAPVSGTDRGQVAKLTAVVAGTGVELYQGTNINLDANVKITTAANTMQLDVYYMGDDPISFAVRVENGLDSAPRSTAPATHTGGGWETLTLTFSASINDDNPANGTYPNLAIYYLWDTGTNAFITPSVARVFYVNDIIGFGVARAETCSDGIMNQDETGIDCGGTCGACPTLPTTAPETAPPGRATEDVISFYSEAYTSTTLTGVIWDNGSDSAEETIATNKVLKITNGTGTSDFIGFDVANTAGFVDATEMTHVHADFYIPGTFVAGQIFSVKLSNHNAETASTQINAIVTKYAPDLTATNAENWISLDMEIGAGDRERIKQVVFNYTNSTGAANLVYVDNVYMYKGDPLATVDNESLNVSMYPNPAADRLNISAADRIKNVSVFNMLGRKVLSLDSDKNSESIDVSNLSSGIYLIKYQLENATGTAKFIKE